MLSQTHSLRALFVYQALHIFRLVPFVVIAATNLVEFFECRTQLLRTIYTKRLAE